MSSAQHPCPICSSTTNPAGEKKGVRTSRVFSLRRCSHCGFVFVESPWTDYASIYDDAYYRGEGSDPLVDYAFEYGNPDETVRQYEWRGIQRLVTSMVDADANWLDFGCGNGGLVRYALGQGMPNIRGTDTGAWADKARKDGLPILTDEELNPLLGTFDIITAIEVIEHIQDPIPVLRRLRSLLKKDGLLFITTGNALTAPGNFVDWPYVSPEIHVSYFTPEALSQALTQAGFAPIPAANKPGWADIIRFKVLKNLRIRRRCLLEKLVPWSLLSPAINARYRFSDMPMGRAV